MKMKRPTKAAIARARRTSIGPALEAGQTLTATNGANQEGPPFDPDPPATRAYAEATGHADTEAKPKAKAAKKKSAKKPTPEQVKARSLAAYKAHLTRQKNALEAAKEPADRTLARKAIKAIKAHMSAVA